MKNCIGDPKTGEFGMTEIPPSHPPKIPPSHQTPLRRQIERYACGFHIKSRCEGSSSKCARVFGNGEWTEASARVQGVSSL